MKGLFLCSLAPSIFQLCCSEQGRAPSTSLMTVRTPIVLLCQGATSMREQPPQPLPHSARARTHACQTQSHMHHTFCVISISGSTADLLATTNRLGVRIQRIKCSKSQNDITAHPRLQLLAWRCLWSDAAIMPCMLARAPQLKSGHACVVGHSCVCSQ